MVLTFAPRFLAPAVAGADLTRSDADAALTAILSGDVDPILVGAWLTAITAKGVSATEMTGFVDAMLTAGRSFTLDLDAIDVVGTGGDQLHTVNISTLAAFTVAGVGVPVAKHGNRSASSSVGSADLLEALGVRLDVSAETVTACVQDAGFGFMFAPSFHPGLAHLAPVRRALGFRTIFNVLGPLANPAGVRRSLIGVADATLLVPMAEVLFARGVTHVILVAGAEGLDELSLSGPSSIAVVTRAGVTHSGLDAPAELGHRHDLADLRGGDLAVNVAIARAFLAGRPGPIFDAVCANAGLALVAAGRAGDLSTGFALASHSVTSGAASLVLDRLVEVSNA